MSSYCPSNNTPFDEIEICHVCGLNEFNWDNFVEETCETKDGYFCCSPECTNHYNNGVRQDWDNPENTPSTPIVWVSLDGKPLTDPYGHLSYSCGDDEDFYCFEYKVIGDQVLMHSVINCETGHFIMNGHYTMVSRNAAVGYALGMFAQAEDWFYTDRTEDPIGEFTNSKEQFIEDLKNDIGE